MIFQYSRTETSSASCEANEAGRGTGHARLIAVMQQKNGPHRGGGPREQFSSELHCSPQLVSRRKVQPRHVVDLATHFMTLVVVLTILLHREDGSIRRNMVMVFVDVALSWNRVHVRTISKTLSHRFSPPFSSDCVSKNCAHPQIFRFGLLFYVSLSILVKYAKS